MIPSPPILDAIRARRDEIMAVAARYGVERIRVFGSVARGTATPASDVDFLVEFLPHTHIGWNIVALADELSAILNCRVDVRTPAELSRHFRMSVLETAQDIVTLQLPLLARQLENILPAEPDHMPPR